MSNFKFDHDLRPAGEKYVWLCSMGLAAGLLMVIGLMLVIFFNGMGVFWPRTVYEVNLHADSQTSAPGERRTFAGSIAEMRPKLSRNAETDAYDREIKFFIGNKDVFNEMFVFIDENDIASRTPAEGVIVAERTNSGDAIFYPLELTLSDGRTVSSDAPEFYDTLQELIAETRARYHENQRLARGPIGVITRQQREVDLNIRVLGRKNPEQAPQLREMERLHADILRLKAAGEDPGELLAQYQVLAGQGGVFSELAVLHQEQERLLEEVSSLSARSRELLAANEANTLRYRLISGEEVTMSIGNVLSIYKPNELNFFQKIGFFIAEVWKFLTEAPRSANTEGGVFPAIFGTFVMTVLMSAAVMPFGVLAAIYLREYARQGPFVQAIRIAINNLAGVPSIVYGIFGLGFFVYTVGGWVDGGSHLSIDSSLWFGIAGTTLGVVVLGVCLVALGLSLKDQADASGDPAKGWLAHGKEVFADYMSFRWKLAGAALLTGVIGVFSGDFTHSAILFAVFAGILALSFVVKVLARVIGARRVFSEQVSRLLVPVTGGLWIFVALTVLFLIITFPGFFADRLLLNEPTFGTGGVLWASLTLALMTVPVVVVASEEALAAVPRGMREASLACGASKWQTIQRVVMPASASGILTGLILAMARGAGEVAPLMVVGVVKLAPDLPVDGTWPFVHLERKFMHLGFHIYDLGFQSPDAEAAKPMVFATTLLLICLVVILNLGAILIRDHLRRKYSSGTF